MYGNFIRNVDEESQTYPHQRKQKAQMIASIRSASGVSRNKDKYEPDPMLLDQYDSFYQTTKSLLVLFQIMGVMPIERSEIGKTTYR